MEKLLVHRLEKDQSVEDGYATLALCSTQIRKAKHLPAAEALRGVQCKGCAEVMQDAGVEPQPDIFIIDEWEFLP